MNLSRALLKVIAAALLLFPTVASAQSQANEQGLVTKLMVHNNPAQVTSSERVTIQLDGTFTEGFCGGTTWN